MDDDHAFLAFVPSRVTSPLPRSSQVTLGERHWQACGDHAGTGGERAVLRGEISINRIRCIVYLVEVLRSPGSVMLLPAQIPVGLNLAPVLPRASVALQRVLGRHYVMLVRPEPDGSDSA